MPRLVRILVAALSATSLSVRAHEAAATESAQPLVDVICPLMEKEALENGLPPAFFMRLIWRESAFRPDVVSHKGAQGIAQFMPGTAKERGLENPFDPTEAIPHSARLLADLKRMFGNLGLAAAAYNAGPERVRGWLSGTRTLPAETRAYVQFVTGHPADAWKAADGVADDAVVGPSPEDVQASCRKRAPALLHVALPAGVKTVAAKSYPWGVQLATAFSERQVAGMLGALRKRYGPLLTGMEPMFVRERNLSRGRRSMVALRMGVESREEAQRFCQKLRAAGAVCTVHRN